jgi:hypothetical protein
MNSECEFGSPRILEDDKTYSHFALCSISINALRHYLKIKNLKLKILLKFPFLTVLCHNNHKW